MSFHAASAVSLAISAPRRSAGNSCTTPPGTGWLLIEAKIEPVVVQHVVELFLTTTP